MRASERTDEHRILLAEDSEDDVLIFRYSMRQAGLRGDLTILNTGEKVIDYVKGKRLYADRSVFPMPSLIFLDGQLHREPSTALLRWIRSHPATKKIPVIVLTGNQDPCVARDARACGALACIPKPMTQEHWTKLRKLLNRA